MDNNVSTDAKDAYRVLTEYLDLLEQEQRQVH